MKVETTGSFMLLDIHGRQEIAAEGVTEVKVTNFVTRALQQGLIVEVLDAPEPPKPTSDAPTSGRAAKK